MPLLADFHHHYRGSMGFRSVCRIRVYQLDSGMTVVIATELPDNPGTSITNWAEFLATEMRRRFVAPGAGLAWIEHSPERPGLTGAPPLPEQFDRVLFRWDGTCYHDPDWRPFSRAQVEALLGEPLDAHERTMDA
jgi:hypothetical protein